MLGAYCRQLGTVGYSFIDKPIVEEMVLLGRERISQIDLDGRLNE